MAASNWPNDIAERKTNPGSFQTLSALGLAQIVVREALRDQELTFGEVVLGFPLGFTHERGVREVTLDQWAVAK